MKFQPVPEEELHRKLPEGIWDAYVEAAENTESKTKKTDMIKLYVAIWDADGKKFVIHAYLAALFSVHAFCKAAGILQKYESGELEARDCIGYSLKVKVKHRTGPDGVVRAQIVDWIADERPSADFTAMAEKAASEMLRQDSYTGPDYKPDDIPF